MSMEQTAQVQMEMPRVPQLEQLQDSALMFLSQQTASAKKVRIEIAWILTRAPGKTRARQMLADLASPRILVQSPRFMSFEHLSSPVADCVRRIPELGISAFTHTRLFDLSPEEIDDLVESEREWRQGKGRRFRDPRTAIEWLNSDTD